MSGVRVADIADAPAIAQIEVDSWRATYAGILSPKMLLGMSVARQTAGWIGELRRWPGAVWVWQDDAGIVQGFGQCGRQRNQALPWEGEIFMLYVQTDAQGAGAGRQLLRAMFAALLSGRQRSAVVWVLKDNPSRFFYERMGAKLVLRRTLPVSGGVVEALGYSWSDLAATLDRWVRSGEPPAGPPA